MSNFRFLALSCLILTFLTSKTIAQAPVEQEPESLHLSGPRIGFVVFTGNVATRIKDPLSSGGLNAQPLMSQFGYQFETAYINSENIQALFEFVPNVTGLDQGKFLPSFSLLHGVRTQKTGWEFVIGPVFYLTKRQKGLFDPANADKWTTLVEWQAAHPDTPDPDEVIKMVDSRGDFGLTTSFLISIGKNFRSGSMNLPINFYAVPHAEGFRYGLSVGFNKKRY